MWHQSHHVTNCTTYVSCTQHCYTLAVLSQTMRTEAECIIIITHFNSLVSDCFKKQFISFTLNMLFQEILVHQTLKKTKVSGPKKRNWSLIASRNSSRLPCHKALPHDEFLFICDQILKVNSNVIVSCIYDNLATPRESPTAYLVPLVIQ